MNAKLFTLKTFVIYGTMHKVTLEKNLTPDLKSLLKAKYIQGMSLQQVYNRPT